MFGDMLWYGASYHGLAMCLGVNVQSILRRR